MELLRIMTFTTTSEKGQVAASGQVRRFPDGFIWGTATAAYQIEGAIDEDGRKPSIWDKFSATPGKVMNGDTGAVACDHYHRWREDIQVMKQLNQKSYRFSVAWPRVIPDGRGKVNEKGLDFYDRLTDGLLEAGIQPYMTLYHWDLPQVLEDAGGWTNRETAYAYAEYVEAVTRRLGNRIVSYITHNEPWCASYLSYLIGEHAPGKHDPQAAASAVHHILLSHGLAVPIIRRNAPRSEVGITLNLWSADPASESAEDAAAAQLWHDRENRMFLDPLFRGSYSQTFVDSLPQGVTLPVQAGDLELIKVPLDFLGINYYNRKVVRAQPGRAEVEIIQPEGLYTTMGWEVYANGLHDLLVQLHQEYPMIPKYFITENGASGEEEVAADGQVHDRLRLYYYQEHLHAALNAIEEGVPLAGYFAWSLMDNFEWAWGYSRRFGIVHVDFESQARLIKDSGYWYSRVVRDNALPEERIRM